MTRASRRRNEPMDPPKATDPAEQAVARAVRGIIERAPHLKASENRDEGPQDKFAQEALEKFKKATGSD